MSRKSRQRPERPVVADNPDVATALEELKEPVVQKETLPPEIPEGAEVLTKRSVGSVFDEIDDMVVTANTYDDSDEDEGETEWVQEWSDTAKKYVWTRYGSQGSVTEYMSIIYFKKSTQSWKTKCMMANPNPGLDSDPFIVLERDTKPSVIAKVSQNREYEFLTLADGKHYLDRRDRKLYMLQAHVKEDGYDDPIAEHIVRKANKRARGQQQRKRYNRMNGR